MLTEKDYCNDKVRALLKEIGCPLVYETPFITLYEVQKWMREEKNIDISVTISPFEYFATIREFVFWQGEYSWEKTIHPNGGKTYEEALSEGIKEAVKILKEEK